MTLFFQYLRWSTISVYERVITWLSHLPTDAYLEARLVTVRAFDSKYLYL
jgi:hypothetical protein